MISKYNYIRVAMECASDTIDAAQAAVIDAQGSRIKGELIASHAFVGQLLDSVRQHEGMNEPETEMLLQAVQPVIDKHQLEIEAPAIESLVGTNNALTFCRHVETALMEKIKSFK